MAEIHPHVTIEMDKKISSFSANKIADIEETNVFKANNIDTADGRTSLTRKPRGVSELDDDLSDDRPLSMGPRQGVDDGLLPVNNNDNDSNNGNNNGTFGEPRKPLTPLPRRPSYPYPGYNGTGYVDINGTRTPIPDINAYQHKKTLAQGMMDLALLSANANQLRYVLESYERHPYYYPSIVFIGLSIFFQVAVGVGLIMNGKYNVRNEKDICRANKINNYTVIGIFIVTVVNVFVSAFGVAEPASQ